MRADSWLETASSWMPQAWRKWRLKKKTKADNEKKRQADVNAGYHNFYFDGWGHYKNPAYDNEPQYAWRGGAWNVKMPKALGRQRAWSFDRDLEPFQAPDFMKKETIPDPRNKGEHFFAVHPTCQSVLTKHFIHMEEVHEESAQEYGQRASVFNQWKVERAYTLYGGWHESVLLKITRLIKPHARLHWSREVKPLALMLELTNSARSGIILACQVMPWMGDPEGPPAPTIPVSDPPRPPEEGAYDLTKLRNEIAQRSYGMRDLVSAYGNCLSGSGIILSPAQLFKQRRTSQSRKFDPNCPRRLDWPFTNVGPWTLLNRAPRDNPRRVIHSLANYKCLHARETTARKKSNKGTPFTLHRPRSPYCSMLRLRRRPPAQQASLDKVISAAVWWMNEPSHRQATKGFKGNFALNCQWFAQWLFASLTGVDVKTSSNCRLRPWQQSGCK